MGQIWDESETNDIIKWCREEDLPEPIFKEVTDNNISPGQASKDLSNLLEKRLIRKQGRGRGRGRAIS